jgi:ATP-binding cassette, subfamily B, bacterial PglK
LKEAFKKFKFLLTKNQIFGIKVLFTLLIFGMLFESGLLYLLIPVIKLITDEEYFIGFKETYFSQFDLINSLDYSQFIVYAITFIILAFLFKNIFLMILTYKQNNFTANLTSNLSVRIFQTFLEKKYSFFVKINSSELLKNLQIDVGYFGALSQSLVSFIIELFLSLAVIFSLIYLEPESAFIAGSTIIISAFIYYLTTRNKLKKIGQKRSVFEKNVAKVIMEGVQGIKDLKIYNKEEDFLNELSGKEYGKARLIAIFNTLNQVPRLIFEFIGILAIMTIIIYKLNFADNRTNLYVTIGLFVAATFKLLPSINRIIGSLQNINYHKATLDILYDVFKNHVKEEKKLKKIHFLNEIALRNVSFSYERGKPILDNLNLTIKKGEFIGLMGQSGVGKSTLVDILIGLFDIDKGNILVDGSEISELYRYNIVGYIPQQITLFDASILKNITLESDEKKINLENIKNAIELSGLREFVENSSDGLNTIVGEKGAQISGGQIKRLGIARALYNNPEILIFDEATSALDKKTEDKFLKQVNKLKTKKTMIFISHDVNCFKYCDRVYELDLGKLKKVEIEK